ncbi:MAG: ester cyclase [Acidimicrobiales bacterium]
MAVATDNAEVFQSYLRDVWENGDLAAIGDYIAPDFVNHNPVPFVGADRDGEAALVGMFLGSFSNLKTKVEEAVPEGDRLAVRWTATGTHTGKFAGVPPTGKDVTMIGIEFLRFADGKIREVWINFDMAGLLQQLGAVPS